jgi:PAS domain S-box-containing protein
VIHPDDVDVLVAEWRRSLKSGEPLEVEARVRRADGQYRWFLHRKVTLRDKHGAIVRWYGSSVDIDDRKQAERALQRSEFYLTEGQRLSDSGSWSFTPEDRVFDYWSPQLYRILGFDPAKGVPTIADYLALVHPEDRKFVEETIDRMIAQGVGCDVKKRVVRGDSQLRFIRCFGSPMFENGRAIRFIGTLVDVTEQERLTQELRRRETYLTEAQRLSHTGSFGWNVSSAQIFQPALVEKIQRAVRLASVDQRGSRINDQALLVFGPSVMILGWTRLHWELNPLLAPIYAYPSKEKALRIFSCSSSSSCSKGNAGMVSDVYILDLLASSRGVA